MNQQEYLEKLNWRYATKQFDATKKLSEAQWHVLAESLRLSPSSYGLQPWKFIVVQNADLRRELRTQTWNQSQVEDCSHYVVFTALKKMTPEYIDRFILETATSRGMDAANLKGYRDMMVRDLVEGPRSQVIDHWAQRQCYIAMGNLMTTAALFNIDACPIEGLVPTEYDRILKLTDYTTIATVALGFRHADDKYQHASKVRFQAKDIFDWR
jgi:nitroreductase